MSWSKITISSADKIFSNYIRQRAKYKCQYCYKLCKYENDWLFRLECSHYFSRKHRATRFDPLNAFSLCSSCHKRMGGYKPSEDGEYDIWVKDKLGDVEYKKLKIRAFSYCKKDPKMELIYVKELWKTLIQ